MYILFDIGGTHMRVAVSTTGDKLDFIETVDTPVRYEDGVARLISLGNKLATRAGGVAVEVIAGGIAGPLDHNKTRLVGGANLTNWIDKPFAAELSRAFHVPVLLQNDAAIVGLGEAVRGAGRHFPIVMYITVSTGVGGARIVHGRIDESAEGFEPGNQIVDAGRTLQDYISGASLHKRTGRQPKQVHDPAVWDDLARVLAIGLNNDIVHWSPDVVVLGGSMITGSPSIPLDATARYLSEFLKVYPVLPAIKKAELGDHGGLYGALEYVKTVRG